MSNIEVHRKPTAPVRIVKKEAPRVVSRTISNLVTPAESTAPSALVPKNFFSFNPYISRPLAPGAVLSRETIAGFLGAAAGFATVAKIEFQPDQEKLYLQAGTASLWSLVAIKAEVTSSDGFVATLPIARVVSVLNCMERDSVSVGISSEHGLCIGHRAITPVCAADEFPSEPLVMEREARCAVPAAYFRDICSRVAPVVDIGSIDDISASVLLDFEYAEIDGTVRLLCTAVGMSACSIHILRMPGIHVDIDKRGRLPPTVTARKAFFEYIVDVANRQWVGMDISPTQIVARGEDYVTVSRVVSEVRTGDGLSTWRQRDIDHGCGWITDHSELAESLHAVSDEEVCTLGIDPEGTMTIQVGEGAACATIKMQSGGVGKSIAGRQYGVASLLSAVESCSGGIVRIGVGSPGDPLVFRGEDEQFKAIVYGF